MAVNPASSAGGQGALTSAANAAGVNQSEFVQLLVAELKNQDPLQPMDPTTFMGQMVQFEELDQLATVAANLRQVETAQAVAEGVALIGRTITYQGSQGPETGSVAGVTLVGGQVSLTVGSKSVPLSEVIGVGG